ncbi:hypothetical protein M9H77_18066 [Catharanthus roseus]|uniref:Uncharacterized protein n=1 Tax=Catharanthus roseus TaxID=4058 RepID=A0ACC0B6Q2_CATRO|nr:hypothetical protein M9H77_18066 [Catharanthus roseus]
MLIRRPIPMCTCDLEPACKCGVLKSVREIIDAQYIMKSGKGLNDSFKTIRSEVLLMSPLPHINMAFNMARTLECNKLVLIYLSIMCYIQIVDQNRMFKICKKRMK